MAANGPDGSRLTGKQLAFVQAYTDPSDPETFGNATQSAIKAGYSEKVAGRRGYKLLQLPKIQDAIAELRARVRDMAALEQSTFVERALQQSDAWLDEQDQPKTETYATNTGELYEREARPSTAEVKALELAGRATGLVGEKAAPHVQVNQFIIEVPTRAETSDEWLRRFQAGAYGGREIVEAALPEPESDS